MHYIFELDLSLDYNNILNIKYTMYVDVGKTLNVYLYLQVHTEYALWW